jgi:hypothetical protein
MMGLDNPGDQRVEVPLRHWEGMKLALWRSKVAWEIAGRAAAEMVAGCKHTAGCPGEASETEVCLRDCPDRELRLSALVVLNSARQFATIDARRPADASYFAPSREHFSEIMAELVVAQAELETLRGKTTTPPPADTPELKETTP